MHRKKIFNGKDYSRQGNDRSTIGFPEKKFDQRGFYGDAAVGSTVSNCTTQEGGMSSQHGEQLLAARRATQSSQYF
jgi:hypothetical protein